MNLLYYALGVLLIFLTKLLVNNKRDEPTDTWKRTFEIPADLTMLAFMMGIAGTASLDVYTRASQIAILGLIALAIFSISLFKKNCGAISSVGGIVQFDNVGEAIITFIFNLILSAAAIYISYAYLGADAS